MTTTVKCLPATTSPSPTTTCSTSRQDPSTTFGHRGRVNVRFITYTTPVKKCGRLSPHSCLALEVGNYLTFDTMPTTSYHIERHASRETSVVHHDADSAEGEHPFRSKPNCREDREDDADVPDCQRGDEATCLPHILGWCYGRWRKRACALEPSRPSGAPAQHTGKEEHQMPLTGKTEAEIAALEAGVLDRIPDDGSLGNQALRESSGLPEEVYLAVRNRLRDSGRLSIGRGRGGSIRKTVDHPEGSAPDALSATEEPVAASAPWEDEASLYPPMLEVLQKRWVQDQAFVSSVVENTSRGGRRPDGTWARPDLTCIAMTSYSYLPGKFLDVVTFEVKPCSGVSLTAVYEALSHRRAATKSHVLLHVPNDRLLERDPLLAEICEEASKHGIGVIVAEDPADFDTWDFREVADRVEPDPWKLNTFIQTQLSQGTRDQVLTWLK